MPQKPNTIYTILHLLVICEPAALDTGCWEWPQHRCKDKDGYGKVRLGKADVRVHRAVYQHFRGAIPAGLVIDHLCRNPCCANVDHLEPVTPAVNLYRGESLQAKNARKTHCSQGHEFTPENTAIYGRMRACRQCRRRWYLAGYARRKAQT